ncbi:hypothetical protein NPIL_583361 [Nephila pilipes]|uniref:Uncharacterized protein n=1 Tax=Nephila pilipes TaxID=299642 RepID=A0A8X6U9R6_NEPPI|nr:hypothetical protein NPIL_583361 [Nephila pilipes]
MPADIAANAGHVQQSTLVNRMMNLYRSFCGKPRDKLSESDGAGSPDHPGIYSPLCTPSRRNNPNSLSFQENPVCWKSSKPPTERREGNSRKKKEKETGEGERTTSRLPSVFMCGLWPPRGFFLWGFRGKTDVNILFFPCLHKLFSN